jgi:hypothetical protein
MLELIGCGATSPLTQANLDKIHENMSTTEVKTILGMPSDSHTEQIVDGTTTTYTYSGTSADVVLVFKNDLLKEKKGTFSK